MEPQSAQEENVESPEKVPMPKAVFASFVGANKDFASTADKSFRPCRVDSPLVYSAERQRKMELNMGIRGVEVTERIYLKQQGQREEVHISFMSWT